MGSRDAYLKPSLSKKLKMPTPQTEQWKTSLCFTGDNPMFPVEMFLRIIEEEAKKKGLNDNDKVLEVLTRVPDYRPSLDDDGTEHRSPGEGSPASSWKRRLLERQRKKQDDTLTINLDPTSGTGGLNWDELKCDMISEFGREPNHFYSTFEKLNLLKSLCKGKSEANSTYLIRVLTVVSILEDDKQLTRQHKGSTLTIPNNYSEPVDINKQSNAVHHHSVNSLNHSDNQHQSTNFAATTSSAQSTHYINSYPSVEDPSLSASRQQYENWLTEQRRLGQHEDPMQCYQQGNNKRVHEHGVPNVTDYSISNSLTNPHMPAQHTSNQINRPDSTEARGNIGGQVDGQYDSPDYVNAQKDGVWGRMLFILGLSRRERSHLIQLGDEIEQKGVIDICSYLTEQKDLHIKQELLSSSDEYDSDEEEEDEEDDKAGNVQNNEIAEDDNFDYQQTLELEMEVGHTAPPIKNEDDEESYFDGNNIKSDPEWGAEEGSSRMIGVNSDSQTLGDKISETNETSRRLKQKLKSTRLKKRVKKEDSLNQIPEGSFQCCELKFETKTSFRHHKKEAHNNKEGSDLEEKDYICKVCGIVCDSKTEYTDHQERQHGIGKANTCPLCLVVLEDRVKRKQHRDDEHSGRRCKCYQCAKELMNFKSLESHIELVHGKDPNNRKITNNSDEGKHIECNSDGTPVHQDLGPGAKVKTTRVIRKSKGPATYICAICGEKVEGRNEMDKHTKEVHKGLKVRCDMCEYVAKGARYMARHRLAKHDLPTAGFKLLKCDIEGCKFRTTENTSLKIHHQAVHEGVRPFPCGACDKSFKFRGSLQTHIDSVHMGMRKYRCDICDRVFTSTFAVANHKTVAHHDGALPDHMCDECGLGFRLLDALKRHKRSVHLKERDFECPHCPPGSRKFFTKNILISHIRGFHQMDKQHACPECGRGFPRAYELKRHIATVHLKFRPYRCGICDARFTHYSSLGYHIAGKHEGMDFRQAKKRKAEMRKHPAFQYIGEVMEGYPE